MCWKDQISNDDILWRLGQVWVRGMLPSLALPQSTPQPIHVLPPLNVQHLSFISAHEHAVIQRLNLLCHGSHLEQVTGTG